MGRKNRDEKRTPQHARGAKRPRSYHRQSKSPGIAKVNDFLDRWRTHEDEEKAA